MICIPDSGIDKNKLMPFLDICGFFHGIRDFSSRFVSSSGAVFWDICGSKAARRNLEMRRNCFFGARGGRWKQNKTHKNNLSLWHVHCFFFHSHSFLNIFEFQNLDVCHLCLNLHIEDFVCSLKENASLWNSSFFPLDAYSETSYFFIISYNT